MFLLVQSICVLQALGSAFEKRQPHDSLIALHTSSKRTKSSLSQSGLSFHSLVVELASIDGPENGARPFRNGAFE